MRDAAFVATMVALIALVVARPFTGILLWSWISFMNPHRIVWGPAAEMPWALAVVVATVIGCLAQGQFRRPAWNPVTLLLLALLAAFTVTSLTALGDPTAVWAKWEKVTKILLVLLFTASLLDTRRRIHAMVWIMVIAIGYYGVRGGIFAIVTGGTYRVWGPTQTIIEDNNHLAAALLVTLPLMNYLRLQSAHAVVRMGLGVAMGLTLLATVASYSRGALLGLGAAALVMWWRSSAKFTTGLMLAICLAGAIAFMPSGWNDRMGTISSFERDESASERLVLWGISFELARAHPFVGTGFTGPYTRSVVDTVAPGGPARAVHSIWFELLGEQGFPTFLLWAGLLVAGMWQAVLLGRVGQGRPDLAWARDLGRMGQVSIVAYLVSGSFLSLSYWDFFWTLLVVIAAAHALARRMVPVAASAASRPWRAARPAPAAIRA